MKITIFHPMSSRNSGDWIILKGTETILKEAYGDDTKFYYQEFGPEFKAEVKDYGSDMLVVSGTPWFWDLCTTSAKYDLLRKVIAVHQKAKKVALGLGSCYPLATNVIRNYIERDGDTSGTKERFTAGVIETFGQFNYITTRDAIAQFILEHLNIKSESLFCPATYSFGLYSSVDGEVEKANPLLIFINPYEFVSSSTLDEIMKEWLLEYQMSIIERYKPDIIVASASDAEWLQKNRLYGKWVLSADEILNEIKTHNPVYSSRVHMAIPARVLGKITYIFALDTRYLTVSKMGAIPIFPFGWAKGCDLTGVAPSIDKEILESKGLMIKGLKSI